MIMMTTMMIMTWNPAKSCAKIIAVLQTQKGRKSEIRTRMSRMIMNTLRNVSACNVVQYLISVARSFPSQNDDRMISK